MPHDCHGNKIEKGDTVTFTAIVDEVMESEYACNAYFKIVNLGGLENYTPTICCNTGLCKKE